MSDFSFMNQMEENTGFSLVYRYHIYHDKLIGKVQHNPEFPESYHAHSFEEVLNIAFLEAMAFYLTEDDKQYYSAQEILFIEKVIETEKKKINNGMVPIDLELSEETMNLINEYKKQHNMTFEEAINDILIKTISNGGHND